MVKWYAVLIGLYSGYTVKYTPLPSGVSLGFARKLLQAKGNIWPYIPPLVPILIQDTLYHKYEYQFIPQTVLTDIFGLDQFKSDWTDPIGWIGSDKLDWRCSRSSWESPKTKRRFDGSDSESPKNNEVFHIGLQEPSKQGGVPDRTHRAQKEECVLYCDFNYYSKILVHLFPFK